MFCSLSDNQLCGINEYGDGTYTAEGIAKIADALKENKSLRSIRCIACCKTLSAPIDDDALKLTAFGLHSLENNALTNYGKDMTGVAAIAEALKVNMTLQSVKYAAFRTSIACE